MGLPDGSGLKNLPANAKESTKDKGQKLENIVEGQGNTMNVRGYIFVRKYCVLTIAAVIECVKGNLVHMM